MALPMLVVHSLPRQGLRTRRVRAVRTWWARWALGAAAVAVAVGVLGLALGWWDGHLPWAKDTRSGNVVVHDGRTYFVSSLEVSTDRLGASIAQDVPYQDTTADLRAVDGFDPEVTLAAYVPPQSSAVPRTTWLLASTDPTVWTDPDTLAQTQAAIAHAR